MDPARAVQLLNGVFSAFDLLVEKHGLEKIKTIGDAYLVAGNLSVLRTDHAEASAELAINLQEEMASHNQHYNTSVHLRIGICTGPVVAGVIGRKKFAYDVWGETVNLACRLEATGKTGKIQIAESTYERLKPKYQFTRKHSVSAKGHGEVSAYWLGNRIGHPAVMGANGKIAA
jgi:class 3 adenylate cyclase